MEKEEREATLLELLDEQIEIKEKTESGGNVLLNKHNYLLSRKYCKVIDKAL